MEHAARCGVETLTHPPPSSPPSERNCTSLPGVTVHSVREIWVSLKLSEKTVVLEFFRCGESGYRKAYGRDDGRNKKSFHFMDGIDL